VRWPNSKGGSHSEALVLALGRAGSVIATRRKGPQTPDERISPKLIFSRRFNLKFCH
jgi:hypothetical protein